MINIQLIINIEIFLFIFIFILTRQIKIYAIFIAFTLIHEMAHALTGVLLGLKIKKIEIFPFGLKIIYEGNNNNKNIEIKKFIIVLVGPLINLIIMVFAIAFNLHTNIVYTNLIIAGFNLIPIYPLDGGRILKSLLSIKINKIKTNYIVNKISNITIILLTAITSILILYIQNIAIIVALAFLWYIVIRENKKYKIIKKVYETIEQNK